MSLTEHPTDELIGVTIGGRYRIISRIGAGGMGTAYRAWDERDGVPVVIKIPQKVFLADPKFAERFQREIRLLQGLRHPHIVPITDAGEHEGLPFVAMRFLPGGSLSHRRLRDEHGKVRPNPPGVLHLWLPAISTALDYVHSQGVIHRDVKPGNIFFDAFWGAYLGDFGIAKIVAESDIFDKEHTLTATHMGIGTQEYMGPEHFTRNSVVDSRFDQYALAVTVYEMMAGFRPFTGANSGYAGEVLYQPVPLLRASRADLPASLSNAVHRGLAKKPAERFATCQEFAEAVLQDVTPIEDEPDVARLLCPQCSNILKLPLAAAGRRGKCPRCDTGMKVANDLGALWLLDEARRQRKAAANAATAEHSGSDSDASAGTPAEDLLEVFEPVSAPSPSGKRRKRKRIPWPSLIAVGVALSLMTGALVLALWLLESGKPRPPSYEAQLAAAYNKLKSRPADLKANDFVGRHLCFKERNWQKGLAYLAKSGAVGVSPIAQREIDAASSQPQEPGSLIRVASEWWRLAQRNDANLKSVRTALRQHAADLFTQHVESLHNEADIAFARDWLKTDEDFRTLAGHKKPPQVDPGTFLADLRLISKVSHIHANNTTEAVGATEYRHSIYIHPRIDSRKSLLAFSLDGRFHELTGSIGILDKSSVIASAQIFSIAGDGKELWKSPNFKQTGKGPSFRINVAGIRKLELVTESLGSPYGAHCVWIDPQLRRLPSSGVGGRNESAAGATTTTPTTSGTSSGTPSADLGGGIDPTVSVEQILARPEELGLLSADHARKLVAEFKGTIVEVKRKGLPTRTDAGALPLNGLQILDAETATILGSYDKGGVFLDNLTTLTPEVAKGLAGHKDRWLSLNGLTLLTPEVARVLARRTFSPLDSLATLNSMAAPDRGGLSLNGLNTISAEVAKELARYKGQLSLDGLAVLVPEVAKEFARHKSVLFLNGLRAITPEAAKELAECSGVFTLSGLTALSPEAAKELANHKGSLYLAGLTFLTPEAAKELANHKGSLYLDGLTSLTPETAKELAAHEKSLYLNGLTSLTFEVAKELANHTGTLYLDGLTSLTPEATEGLTGHKGWLSLESLSSLTPELARELARKGSLRLPSLTTLTPEVARELARYDDREISLKGLTSLTPEVAHELAGYKGHLLLGGLRAISPELQIIITGHQGKLCLHGIEAMSPEEATLLRGHQGELCLGIKSLSPEVAKVLAGNNGTLSLRGLTTITSEVANELIQFNGKALLLDGSATLPETAKEVLRTNPRITFTQ